MTAPMMGPRDVAEVLDPVTNARRDPRGRARVSVGSSIPSSSTPRYPAVPDRHPMIATPRLRPTVAGSRRIRWLPE